MKPRRVKVRASFRKALDELPEKDALAAIEAVQKFVDRSAENALQVEKKQGLDCWAFRVKRSDRVFFYTERDEVGTVNVLFHVGRHDDYRIVRKKRWAR